LRWIRGCNPGNSSYQGLQLPVLEALALKQRMQQENRVTATMYLSQETYIDIDVSFSRDIRHGKVLEALALNWRRQPKESLTYQLIKIYVYAGK